MRKKSALKTDVAKTPKKDLQCDICNKSGFSTTYKLKSHLFLHRAIPARYKCTFCSKEYFRSDEYSRHIAIHNNMRRLSYCDHCDRAFVDKRNLAAHLKIHDDSPRISDVRYRCVACGVDYCEERLLKYHIRKQHLNLKVTEPEHLNKNVNETWIENAKDEKSCIQITKLNPNTLIMKSCKITCNNKKNDNGTDDKNVFQQYISSIFAGNCNNYYSKAICDYCGKEMLKKSVVTHIRERHMKLRKFNCNVCNKSYARHYQLSLHNCGDNRKRRRNKAENVN